MGAIASSQSDYPVIFRDYVAKSVQYVLAQVEQAKPIIPPDDVEQALHTLNFAFNLPENWPYIHQLLLSLAPKIEQAGYRDEWVPYLIHGIEQSEAQDDTATAAELRLYLGIIYQLRSKYDLAREQLEVSAAGFEQLGAHRNQARALNQLAYVARLQREFHEAESLVKAAQQLLEAQDTEHAFSYYVLGLVALDKRTWQKAVDFSKKAFNIWSTTGNRRLMGRSLLCMGVALEKMEQYVEATVICQQAVSLFEEIQDSFYQAIAQMNLGNVYLALEQSAEALESFLFAERIFYQLQDHLHQAHVNNNLGIAYRQLQQWDNAKLAYLASIEQYKMIDNISWLVNTMDGLGLTYVGKNQYEKALSTFEQALDQLKQIEGKSGYDYLFDKVINHLREVQELAKRE